MATKPTRFPKNFRIHAKAPTRMDLAGGTVDIWPLYLFVNEPVTVNVAIDLFAEADLEVTPAREPGQGRYTLRSEDQQIERDGATADLAAPLPAVGQVTHPALVLHLRILHYFASKVAAQELSAFDLTLKTRAKSPAGAGLGGSSTLSVALIGAIASWAQGAPIDPAADGEKFIDIVRDIETRVIEVPAGLQDYYGAMFGGLQALRWGPARHDRESLTGSSLRELERRLLLFYSGQSRNSGINNWALFKSYIDRDSSVQTKFQGISDHARELAQSLQRRDWAAVGRHIADEWAFRRTLAPGISTAEMDAAFAEASKLVPRLSGKVCGAGGGGCFFLYSPEPFNAPTMHEAAEKILKIFNERGIPPTPLPCRRARIGDAPCVILSATSGSSSRARRIARPRWRRSNTTQKKAKSFS